MMVSEILIASYICSFTIHHRLRYLIPNPGDMDAHALVFIPRYCMSGARIIIDSSSNNQGAKAETEFSRPDTK